NLTRVGGVMFKTRYRASYKGILIPCHRAFSIHPLCAAAPGNPSLAVSRNPRPMLAKIAVVGLENSVAAARAAVQAAPPAATMALAGGCASAQRPAAAEALRSCPGSPAAPPGASGSRSGADGRFGASRRYRATSP